MLKVDSKAPLPKLPAPTLNLDGYKMTFDDEFDDLSVSAAGPGTRWFTATKENFGDARFVEQKDGFPFTVDKGVLRIEAAKKGGGWQSGILASADPKGGGFSQKFGYFEMRAKFPKSRGMWPAFWLLGQPSLTDKKRTNVEIDVVEHYGVLPNAINSTMHLWHADGKHWAKGDFIAAPGLTDDFHNYGVMVDEANVVWYFDGVEVQRQKTPEDAEDPAVHAGEPGHGRRLADRRGRQPVVHVRGLRAGLRQAPLTRPSPRRLARAVRYCMIPSIWTSRPFRHSGQ